MMNVRRRVGHKPQRMWLKQYHVHIRCTGPATSGISHAQLDGESAYFVALVWEIELLSKLA